MLGRPATKGRGRGIFESRWAEPLAEVHLKLIAGVND
jgi:hypothetical protein